MKPLRFILALPIGVPGFCLAMAGVALIYAAAWVAGEGR